ncbi:hypothetical protein VTI74DRAFT_10984 [Chaetomium olivicolor]
MRRHHDGLNDTLSCSSSVASSSEIHNDCGSMHLHPGNGGREGCQEKANCLMKNIRLNGCRQCVSADRRVPHAHLTGPHPSMHARRGAVGSSRWEQFSTVPYATTTVTSRMAPRGDAIATQQPKGTTSCACSSKPLVTRDVSQVVSRTLAFWIHRYLLPCLPRTVLGAGQCFASKVPVARLTVQWAQMPDLVVETCILCIMKIPGTI